jgi:hypothetical protein
MRQLLEGAFAPITYCVGFLEAALEQVCDAHLTWIRRNHQGVDCRPLEGRLPELLRQLEPLSTPARRSLLVATESSWTAYFDSTAGGTDARSPVCYLAQQLRCRGLVVTCVPHTLHTETGTAKGTYGAVIFEMFAPERRAFLNYERSVCVAYEGGRWSFETQGEVQPFEETEQYQARRKRERVGITG